MSGQADYEGVLGTAHLRAVVRTGLQAHGFVLSGEEFRRTVEAQVRLGVWLRDEAVPRAFPPLLAETYGRVLAADDYAKERLQHTTSLGHSLAYVIHRLSGGSERSAVDVALLGALLNAAVAAIDSVVDDGRGGDGLFQFLDPALVAEVFAPDSDFENLVAGMLPGLTDRPSWCLAILLVAGCALVGRRLLRLSGNGHAWRHLEEHTQRLFAAERMTLVGHDAGAVDLATAAETKSVLPASMMLGISMLARPADRLPAPEVLAGVEQLGQALSLADDLVDLADDARRGAPNVLLLRSPARPSQPGGSLADADLYDLVDAGSRALGRLATQAPAERGHYRIEDAETFAQLSRGVVLLWVGRDEVPCRLGSARQSGAAQLPAGRAQAAVAMLLAQQARGYAEATHHLCFPRLSGHGQPYETHPASLSFRAVALDALLDARDIGLDVPNDVLHAEALAILRTKHRLVRGGWSYIQEVPELPPDADDLGQVLQVLTRLGGAPLAATCDEPVRMVLDGMQPDGGFSTWVLDRRRRSSADDAVRAYLAVMGGWGVHPEVMANLLWGLMLAHGRRYRGPLLRAASYLESVQEPDGTWKSRWYAGPFYGTYRVGAVLAELGLAPDARERAAEQLVQLQKADGGWGLEKDEGTDPRTDELSTALAVLALVGLGLAPDTAVIRRGVERLLLAQAEDGGWPAYPWIVFPTLDGLVTYGSRSMTTAFALKALAAAATGRVLAQPSGVRQ
jgi:squalene-hopene/tetraprenyl-beta-curcumene cyclase